MKYNHNYVFDEVDNVIVRSNLHMNVVILCMFQAYLVSRTISRILIEKDCDNKANG